MLTNNFRTGKILIYIGFLSLFAELFAIYYVTPSTGNPSIPVHPILNFLGNGEQFIGSLIIFSVIMLTIGFLILNNRKLYLISYIVSTILMVVGMFLFIYGILNPIQVMTNNEQILIQLYGIRGGLTVFSGFFILIFTAIFQLSAIKEAQKKQTVV